MKVLFISGHPHHIDSAYQYRMDNLMGALQCKGAKVDMIFSDRTQFFLRSGWGMPIIKGLGPIPWDRYDFIHAGAFLLAGSLAFSRKHGAKVVFDCHGYHFAEVSLNRPGISGKLLSWLTHRCEFYAAHHSNSIITVSKPLIKSLEDEGIDSKKIALIRNGVEDSLFINTITIRTNPNKFTVTYAGAFQKYQAVDIFLQAARLLKDFENINWRIIGFSRGDTVIKEKLRAEMPANTQLIDRCDRKELVQWLLASDLLAVPRKPYLACKVAFPTKFGEYMALAKPVLVNTVDETAQIVRKHKCGFVAEPNAESMAKTILHASKCPPEQLEQMGKAGRDFVKQELCWDVIGGRYMAFLENQI